MTNEEIEKLLHLNQRLNFLLGFALGFIKAPFESHREFEQYKWLCKAIENIVYLDKPFPPAL
jgi:hypothetical protein